MNKPLIRTFSLPFVLGWMVLYVFLGTGCITQAVSNLLPDVGCDDQLPTWGLVAFVEMPLLDAVAPEKDEKVALVGASDGSRGVRMALLADSLNLYLQDIDTACLNQRHLSDLIEFYSPMHPDGIHSNFHLVLGTETSTNLPHGGMDKIVMVNTLHHFSDRHAMLVDIRKSLKPGGLFFVAERLGEMPYTLDPSLCDIPLLDRDQLECSILGAGFELVKVEYVGGGELFTFRRGV